MYMFNVCVELHVDKLPKLPDSHKQDTFPQKAALKETGGQDWDKSELHNQQDWEHCEYPKRVQLRATWFNPSMTWMTVVR